MQYYYKIKERGITLFIAMIVTATLLLISTGIVTLAVREAKISSTARESQHAFYAADTGIECALYWSAKSPVVAGSTITCNNTVSPVFNGYPFTFDVNFSPDPYCATVTIARSGGQTTIESRGHNTCDTTNSRRVERAVKVTY
ncbi:pilus assembly PilX N-terminal domain-containing protein [Candidatus Parcubacteria bacterium]|nr:pilus assembly PilX N-terminal domain-containing protein [Candidatus Parcubacteria bacterium]